MALATVLSAPALSQESEHDLGVRPTGRDCDRQTSEKVSLQTVLSGHSAYRGKCVIVDGYLYQRALFSQKKDTQVKYAASDKKTQGRRVGIYASDDVMERLHALPKASYVRVMGKIWDCESMQTPETLMLVGYCHYTGGPTLNAVTIEDVKAPK